MERTRIDSDALRAVGFDQSAGVLEVEFSSREVYQYFDVSLGEVVALMIAPSRYQHFQTQFKPFHPRSKRVEP